VADVLPAGHPQKKVLAAYKKAYESKFHEDASTFGGHAYDAFLVLAEGIRKAGGTDPSAVRTAIESLKGVVGTAGVFNFSPDDHNGLTMDSFEMLTVKNGQFALYP
jgi:branched-chain amino acid transport system substrate-binding protein